jgi:streptogramin lyase
MRARIAALVLVASAALAGSAQAAVREYPLANPAVRPSGIAADASGNLWFTETDGACAADPNNPDAPPGTCGAIGEMTSSGSVLGEYPLPNQASSPSGITIGPDGAIWFTESGNDAIGRLDPSRAQPGTSDGITEYPVPTAGAEPTEITVGPDRNLWFTERGFNDGNRIGELAPAQAQPGTSDGITEYCIRGKGSTGQPCMTPALTQYSYAGLEPTGIVSGPDGRLWFTETNPYCSDPGLAGETAPDGQTLTASSCDPYDNGSGNDDGIGVVGAISTTGTVSEYALPATQGQEQNDQPLMITSGPDGALWFTEYNASAIGRITPAGSITQYEIPGSDTQPTAITEGPDGQVWFALSGAPSNGGNRLAEINPASASPGTSSGIGLFPQLTAVYSCSSCSAGSSQPAGLTAADGDGWFTEEAAGNIGSQPPQATTAPPPPSPPADEVKPQPPVIVDLPGPPAFPAIRRVQISDDPFADTPSARAAPTSARWVRCHAAARRKALRRRARHVHCQGVRRRASPARGTVFTYDLAAAATVQIGLYDAVTGGTVGRLVRKAAAGRNVFEFTGWLGDRPLPPGRYEAEFTAKNPAGTSRPVTVRFTVVSARPVHR